MENALFLLAVTASQWHNVLFNPNLFEAQPRCSVLSVSFGVAGWGKDLGD